MFSNTFNFYKIFNITPQFKLDPFDPHMSKHERMAKILWTENAHQPIPMHEAFIAIFAGLAVMYFIDWLVSQKHLTSKRNIRRIKLAAFIIPALILFGSALLKGYALTFLPVYYFIGFALAEKLDLYKFLKNGIKRSKALNSKTT